MAWDAELARELTPEEELARLRDNPTSIAQAVLEHEARTGQRSPLRDHPEISGPTELPEINVYDNEPDVIAVEDKPTGGSKPEQTPTQYQATAAEVLKKLEGEAPQTSIKPTSAEELAALLHPSVERIDTGLNPVWPPTAIGTDKPPARGRLGQFHAPEETTGVDRTQAQAVLDRTLEPTKQFVQGTVGSTLAAPWTLAAGLTALPEYGARKAGIVGDDTASPTAYSMARSQTAQDIATHLSGASENPEGLGKVANVVGSSVTPAGRFTAPMTAGLSAMRLSVDEFAPRAQGAEALPRPGVTHTVESIGGPAKVKDSELLTLGGLAAVTLGAVFAPMIYSKLKYTSLPKFRPVENAAPGTITNSTPTDLARTFDDANAGVIRMAKNAGVHPAAVKALQDTFQIQTRATAQTIANSAVQNGRAEVPNFTFQVKIPLAKLNQTMTQPAANYLHTLDTLDELFAAKQKPGRNAGLPKIRGMDEHDALAQIWALEQSNPGVKIVAQAYRENLRALRKFESTGEFATLNNGRAKLLNANRKNEVPWNGPGDQRVMGEAVDRGNPIEALAGDMTYRLRARMENEAKGQYVDAVRRVEPSMFKRVYPQQQADRLLKKDPTGDYPNMQENPHWRDNTVKIYRRGKAEYYTTDPFVADVLRMDPYYYSNPFMNGVYSLKRGFEMTTTGALAPWFAPTSALRNWLISKHTAPEGTKSPTLLGTAYAVPQQLIPQLSQRISESLDKGNMGWLRNVISQPAVDATSRWMANAYANSLYARVQSLGTHRNSLMEQQVQAQSKLAKALQEGQGAGFDLLRGYSELLSAIHNAPSFAYISKNSTPSILERVRGMSHTMPMPMNELAMEARNLTGDPHIGGRYFNDKGKPIRFEDATTSQSHSLIPGINDQSDRLLQLAAKGYGSLSELGRDAIPWFNQTEQGAKRLGKAYLDNPAKFTGRFWAYSMMPAAAGYLYARSLGNDPNGTNYVDYMMNRRSEYAKTMYYYVPIPGRPAEEGVEWPRFHEGSLPARMMEAGLDHMFRSAVFSESEDFHHAAASFLDVAIIPPLPPVFNTMFATQGMVGPQGVFGGEAYMRKSDPFDQTAGMSSNTELIVRSLVPGIADITGSGWAAMTQTPDGVDHAVKNAIKEMSKRVAIRTVGVRDIANLHNPISGNTEIVSELFKKQKAIDQLVRYYMTYDNPAGPGSGVHEINTKPISKSGAITADKLLGPNIPKDNPGLDQPPPTNPLYDQFISDLYLKVHKDSEKTGGEGFKSLWDRYRDLSDGLTKMRNINAGNLVTWQKQMEDRPALLKLLEDNHIDKNDPYVVRNFYERKRQDAARTILFFIRNVEDRMSTVAGTPIHIEDLRPYDTEQGIDAKISAPSEFNPYGTGVP